MAAAAATTNSYVIGNQTEIPSFKPKTISQSLLHLTKPHTVSLTSRTKSVSIRCASETTVYSFATGVAGFPTAIPHNVFLEARSELYNWEGTGKSVKEMRYPDCEFYRMIQKAEYFLRLLLKIPSDYSVLFLRDGAPNQLAALPQVVMELEDESDFDKIVSSDKNRISITDFGSLLSERSARSTFPDLENFRIAKLEGFRRVFAHAAPIFFERGIANPETKEISSLSVEPCEGESLVVTVFEIQRREVPTDNLEKPASIFCI